MHVMTAKYLGNPNIGLFCYASDKYCLVPKPFPENIKKQFEEILKVPVYEMHAAGTSLLGVFFAGNENSLLVPEIMFDSELRELERLKIPYKVIKSELTALGNNLLINKNACLANPDYDSKILKEIEIFLQIKVKTAKISDLNILGSLATTNTLGCLATSDIFATEKKFLEKSLKVKVTPGTINFGSPYVSSGIVCNTNGFIIGESSGGPEIQNADIALGFIKG